MYKITINAHRIVIEVFIHHDLNLSLVDVFTVDQRVVFSDSNTYYQFSFEECDSASCEFRSNEAEWPEAVRLLVQLAPYVQFRSGGGTNSP